MKRCTKCGIEKPPEELGKDASRPGGLFPHCRACKVIATTKWRLENPEKAREIKRRLRAAAKARRAA
jgi:hypothetical protein